MFREIHDFASTLCDMANKNLEEIVINHCESLPFYLHFATEACYVKYDTHEETITDISLRLIERNGFAIEVDPINGYIQGIVAGKSSGSTQMNRDIADALFACIHQCWIMRLSTEQLLTTGDNDRYIAADLLG